MAQGHHLHLRLFLEGVEVPVISAQIQVTANAPASASIQVIATDKVLDLLPRTVVHLFYFDYMESGDPKLDRDPDDRVYDTAGEEVLTYDDQDFFNSRYKLLFMGELFSIEFQKTSFNRAVVLQCSDFSNYWDTTFQYNFGGSLFGGRREAAFIGANSNFFTSPLGHGVGTISALLNAKSANFPELTGLMAGIVRMLEAIGGSYYGKNVFRGCNDFTSIAELRLKILQQIVAAEKDASTSKLFARKAFNMWMNRQSGSLGKLVSFRGLVKLMFDFIFHEVYPCPAAKYVPAVNSSKTVPTKGSISLESSAWHGPLAKKAKSTLEMAQNATDRLKAWYNVRGFDTLAWNAIEKYKWAWHQTEQMVKDIYILGATATGASSGDILKSVSAAQSNMQSISQLQRVHGAVFVMNWGGRAELEQVYPKIQEYYGKVIEALKMILGIKIGTSSTRTSYKNMPSRVNNQIFRPDIFYAPPPRCNVLFPETYDQFSFSRQYMREVSRIELQTHNELLGNDALFNGRYYAPDIEDVRRAVKLSSMQFAKLIMDHELYTGIIPMFENMSEANIFSMASGKTVKEGQKVGFAQRAVNHQYFKYRFQARAMDASGRFNPGFVPGFPSLIIDKPMDAPRLAISALPIEDQLKALSLKVNPKEKITRSQILQQLVSPQYLGVCASLVHSVTQDGGRTQYNFMHARVHRESTEFLGVDKVTVSRELGMAIRPSVVAAPVVSPPKKKSRGPHGGVVLSVKDVSKSYKGKLLPILGMGRKGRVGDQVPVDYRVYGSSAVMPQQTSAYFTEETEGAGSGQSFLGANTSVYEQQTESSFTETTGYGQSVVAQPTAKPIGGSVPGKLGAYEVSEQYMRRYKEKVDLPIEEAIKAPWIWSGWSNPQVNETYMQFFGTTGITDVAGVNAAEDIDTVMREESLYTKGTGTKKKKSKPLPQDVRENEKKEAKQYQKAVLLGDTERTVENSVDFLVRAYSFVKIHNADVGDFLRSYGWRPVATMVDILGSADLEIKKVTKKVRKTVRKRFLKKQGYFVGQSNAFFSPTATGPAPQSSPFLPGTLEAPPDLSEGVTEFIAPVYGTKYSNEWVDQVGYEVSGKEGFHSRAFGDTADLFGLVSPTVQTVLQLGKQGKRKVAERMDVRKRRREVVRNYVEELTGSRGLLG